MQSREDLEEEIAYLRRELGFAIDTDKEARVRTKLKLQPQEARLILALNATGRVMSRAHLECSLNRAWDSENIKIVDVYVSRIRKKLPGSIETFRPYGYAITPQGKAALGEIL